MKPANHYASTTAIPKFVEDAIAKLNQSDKFGLINNLTWSMTERELPFSTSGVNEWSSHFFVYEEELDAVKWLQNQSVDTFKSLLKWIVNELI